MNILLISLAIILVALAVVVISLWNKIDGIINFIKEDMESYEKLRNDLTSFKKEYKRDLDIMWKAIGGFPFFDAWACGDNPEPGSLISKTMRIEKTMNTQIKALEKYLKIKYVKTNTEGYVAEGEERQEENAKGV